MTDKRKKPTTKRSGKTQAPVNGTSTPAGSVWKWLLPVLAITGVLYIPALQNGLTNWDDLLYITNNSLLKDLSFEGLKKIWSTPVVSNYHPLTIMSLALNYQIAGLEPATYHLTSLLLHVINSGLVFWLIWLLSGKNAWVSAIVALLFGIHPMHVESVAWASERKDLLYTLFYVSAMILYVRYIRTKEIRYLLMVTVLGALSLLSKPAAIVLPLSLLALDYYLRRPWNLRWITEKIPLFILSGIFTYATLSIQAKRAIASVDQHDILERIHYAGFGVIWYLLKAIVPYPLSALHPYPKELTVWYYLATLLAVAGVALLAWKVRNRNVIFGFGFYVINLLLVLQLVSIGNAVVAERYTYVPYIGLFFVLAMEGYKALQGKWSRWRMPVIVLGGIWIAVLVYVTWTHIPTWKNSQSLWSNVLDHYPESARAWVNKGLDFYDQQKWPETIEHLSNALKHDPTHADGLEWRSKAYLESKQPQPALEDAMQFRKYYPQKEVGYFILARAQGQLNMAGEAIDNFTFLISNYPPKPEYYNNRGVVLFNKMKDYNAAMADFQQAINLNPKDGSVYLNLSRCLYMLGNTPAAKEQAAKAKELGAAIDPGFAQMIGM